jgi:hypothetical protein
LLNRDKMSVRPYNTLYFNYLVPPLTAPANRKCNGRDTFSNKFTLTLDTFFGHNGLAIISYVLIITLP